MITGQAAEGGSFLATVFVDGTPADACVGWVDMFPSVTWEPVSLASAEWTRRPTDFIEPFPVTLPRRRTA
ncbi:MAG: hypothetical protein ACOZNI_19285 [Myxococcota bacterium]